MKFEMSGFDELEKQLKKMEKGARELEQTEGVTFSVLFNESFMKKNTKFNSINDFFKASPFDAETDEDFDAIDENELDKYVESKTKFRSWEEMLNAAIEEYTIGKLGL